MFSAPGRILRIQRGGAIEDLIKLWARYGDVVDLSLFDWHAYLITDPALAHEVLVDRHDQFVKSRNYRELALVLGNGLVNSEGAFWRRQRRLAQPAFHRDRIVHFADGFARDAQALTERWQTLPPDQPIDVAAEMVRLTFEIVGHALFSTDVAGFAGTTSVIAPSTTAVPPGTSILPGTTVPLGAAIHFAIDFVNRRATIPLHIPLWWPSRKNLRFRRAMRALNAFVAGLIRTRRADPTPHRDLLALLMNAQDDETGEGMTDQQLRDEVMTFVLAGHETTANTLSWTLYLLARHPEEREKLEAELATVLGGRAPTFSDLSRLQVTRMVIEESMRLFPAVWLIERSPIADTELGGYTIPSGAILMIYTYGIHHHPRYWPDPEVFRPERFEVENGAAVDRSAYLPFSHGPRQCIGAQFAMTEAQIILATIAQRFRLRLVDGHPVVPEPSVTLRPRHGVMAYLEKRSAA